MLYPQKWALVLMGESALIFLLVATVNCTNNRGVAVFELCPWCWAREHWTLGSDHFTVHRSIRVCGPTKQLDWQPINMTRQRAVCSDMSGVWWGEACSLRLLVDSSPWPRQTRRHIFMLTVAELIIQLYYHQGCILFFRLRDDVPTFHVSLSKQTEASRRLACLLVRRGLKAVLCSFVERLTPQHVAVKIWSEASSVRASQMPNATLTKGNTGKMCCEFAPKACFKSWIGFNMIQMWAHEAALLFTSILLYNHVLCTCECYQCYGERRNNEYTDKCIRHGSASSAGSARKLCLSWLIAGMTAWTPSSIRYEAPLQSCLQQLITTSFTHQHLCLWTLNYVSVAHLKKKKDNAALLWIKPPVTFTFLYLSFFVIQSSSATPVSKHYE